jgi:photosystem II stability/assembly factor-like uncharacterized protein
MRKFLRNCFAFLICWLVNTAALGQPFWEKVLEFNPYSYMEGIAFNSNNWVYLACSGDSAGVFRSKDYGTTWQKIFTGRSDDVSVDKYDNIIITATYRILRSTDRGDSWTEVVNTLNDPLYYENLAYGYDSIFLSGCYSVNGIVRSADNGLTWKKVLTIHHDLHYFENITDFCFGTNGIIYATTEITDNSEYIPGNVYSSTDLGKTWQLFLSSGDPQSVSMDTSGRLLLGQFADGIYRYDFDQAAWTHMLPWAVTPLKTLTLQDGKIVLGLMQSIGGVLLSEDNGETYSYINEGLYQDYHTIRDIKLDHIGKLWICDDNTLFRTVDTLSVPESLFIPPYNRIEKTVCYPNPFNDYIEVEYKGSSTIYKRCNATIYNSYGQVVFSKKDIHFVDKIKLSLPEVPAGIYLMNLTGRNINFSSKIIHL